MPVLPSTAYLTVESSTTLARAVVNDMLFSAQGEILTDTAFFTFPMVNDALEWFTNEVNNHGIDTFTKETVLTPILPIAVNDPGVQVNVSDTGYFDGVDNFESPQVPTDLLVPKRIWERQTGTTEQWRPMREILDGLPSICQGDRLGIWEWRSDAINMPGAVQSNDLRVRYEGSQGTLATPQDVLLFRGATGPIAYKLASVFLFSKNPEAATAAGAEAKLRVGQLATRNARMKQRVTTTRRSYGSQGRCGSSFFIPHN